MESYVEATKKLNEHMKQVIAECGEGDFVPPVIAPTARIVSIDLSTKLSADGGLLYTYQVKCTTDSVEEKKKEEEEKPVALVKKTSSMLRIPGKVKCDGPCQKVVDLEHTAQFGCYHSICETCRQTAPSVACFDGSPGCCNEQCVAQAKADGQKTRAGPSPASSESKKSIVSNPSTDESIHVHVAMLKCSGMDAYRYQVDYEFSSTTRISKLVKALSYHYKDLLDNSRFYYSLDKPKSRRDLEPFSLTNTHLRFYDIAPSSTQDIYFMIVGNRIGLF